MSKAVLLCSLLLFITPRANALTPENERPASLQNAVHSENSAVPPLPEAPLRNAESLTSDLRKTTSEEIQKDCRVVQKSSDLFSTTSEALNRTSETSDSATVTVKHRKHTGLKRFLHRITEIDSNYIEANKYRFQTFMLGEKRWSYLRMKGSSGKQSSQSLYFYPESPFKVGPYIGYSLFFLGYTFDVGHKESSINRSNIYLSLYSSMFGIDYTYESGTNNYRILRVKGFGADRNERAKHTSFSGLSTYFRNLHFYYLFNHKHFSYPAAYGQSTVQRRSAGSFILGFNFTLEKVRFDHTKLPSFLLLDDEGNALLNDNLKMQKVQYRDYSVSLGYGYNWVFAKNFLSNLTLAPTVGYNFAQGEKFSTRENLFNLEALNFDLISRASVVWNNSRYFAGLSFVGHTYSYRKPSFSVQNAYITANVYVGMNFIRKKHKKSNSRL